MISSLKKYIKRTVFKRIWNSKGVFPYYNHKVYFPNNSIIFKRALVEGIYESENVNLMSNLVKENSVVLDIGANIGLMALPMLSLAKQTTVISVEPSPNSFPFLLKTQQGSQYKNKWFLINKAVSNTSGTINFQLAKGKDAAYESIKDTNRAEFINSIEVECTTIDQIWEEYAQPNVSFIKIDIEGADLLALQGGKNCIGQNRPYILMEWNKINIIPFGVTNNDLLSFAKAHNYSIYVLPYFSKCNTIEDLDLFIQLSENFLLVPNQEVS